MRHSVDERRHVTTLESMLLQVTRERYTIIK